MELSITVRNEGAVPIFLDIEGRMGGLEFHLRDDLPVRGGSIVIGGQDVFGNRRWSGCAQGGRLHGIWLDPGETIVRFESSPLPPEIDVDDIEFFRAIVGVDVLDEDNVSDDGCGIPVRRIEQVFVVVPP